MNVLSSLLYWIGNTIGYNPNTLTTTDKTIVGAINEVNSKADATSANVYTKDDFIIISGTFSKVPKNETRSEVYDLSGYGVDDARNVAVISIRQNDPFGRIVYNPYFGGKSSGMTTYNIAYPQAFLSYDYKWRLWVAVFNGDESDARDISYEVVLLKIR